jgi:hypothetical protein
VFGDPDTGIIHFKKANAGASFRALYIRGTQQDLPTLGKAHGIAQEAYWTDFAKTGDPNAKGLPAWPVFKGPDMPPHILGGIADYPTVDVLNPYDEQYAKILTTLTASDTESSPADRPERRPDK